MSHPYDCVYDDMVAEGVLPPGKELATWEPQGHEVDADIIVALAGRSADVERSTLRNRTQISAKIWAVMQLSPQKVSVLEHIQLIHSWVLFYQREPAAIQNLAELAEK